MPGAGYPRANGPTSTADIEASVTRLRSSRRSADAAQINAEAARPTVDEEDGILPIICEDGDGRRILLCGSKPRRLQLLLYQRPPPPGADDTYRGARIASEADELASKVGPQPEDPLGSGRVLAEGRSAARPAASGRPGRCRGRAPRPHPRSAPRVSAPSHRHGTRPEQAVRAEPRRNPWRRASCRPAAPAPVTPRRTCFRPARRSRSRGRRRRPSRQRGQAAGGASTGTCPSLEGPLVR